MHHELEVSTEEDVSSLRELAKNMRIWKESLSESFHEKTVRLDQLT